MALGSDECWELVIACCAQSKLKLKDSSETDYIPVKGGTDDKASVSGGGVMEKGEGKFPRAPAVLMCIRDALLFASEIIVRNALILRPIPRDNAYPDEQQESLM